MTMTDSKFLVEYKGNIVRDVTHGQTCLNSGPANDYPKTLDAIFIPSILNEILSYLSQSELKSCRNVSLQWAEEGWKLLRRNAVLPILRLEDLEKVHEYFLPMKNNICTNIRFKEFTWSIADDPVFQKFSSTYGYLIKYIHLSVLSTYIKEEHHIKSKIFKLFPFLEELVLSFQEPDMVSLTSSIPSTETSNDRNIHIYPFMDNLKILRLQRIFRKEDGAFVMEIIKAAPNLQTISLISKKSVHSDVLTARPHSYSLFPHLGILDGDNENVAIRPFHDFRVLRHNGNFGTYNELLSHYFLKERQLCLNNILHLNFHILITSNTQLHALKSRQCFALRSLHLVLCANLCIKEIRLLVSSFSETLKTFYLSLNGIEKDLSQISRYSQIWDMSLEWKKLSLLCLRNIQSFSIPFADIMPQLKTLLLYGSNFPNLMTKGVIQSQENCISCDHSQNKLQNLIVHCDKSKRLTVQVVMTVATQFPNLKKLKLENLSDSGLRTIFSSLHQLEDLFLMSDQFSDSGITGLRPDVCRKLLKTKEIPNKSFPCIGDLKRLRKLEIASPKISDVSILHGIADCKSLRKLFLYSPKISSKSVRKVINDMNLVVLEMEFCHQLSDTIVQFAKKNFTNPTNVHINKQGPKSTIQVAEYFKTRGATFYFRD